jgi:hypothetical protein
VATLVVVGALVRVCAPNIPSISTAFGVGEVGFGPTLMLQVDEGGPRDPCDICRAQSDQTNLNGWCGSRGKLLP